MWTTIFASLVFAFFFLLYRLNLIPIDFLTSISNPPHR
jgi:hypothetical protein